MLTIAGFRSDPHAAKYVPELEKRPAAAQRLLAILNARENEGLLIHEADRGDPPLDGVVRSIEADPEIRQILATGAAGHRFRQTVGVAVRLRMEQLGWRAGAAKALSGVRTSSRKPSGSSGISTTRLDGGNEHWRAWIASQASGPRRSAGKRETR